MHHLRVWFPKACQLTLDGVYRKISHYTFLLFITISYLDNQVISCSLFCDESDIYFKYNRKCRFLMMHFILLTITDKHTVDLWLIFSVYKWWLISWRENTKTAISLYVFLVYVWHHLWINTENIYHLISIKFGDRYLTEFISFHTHILGTSETHIINLENFRTDCLVYLMFSEC